MFPPTSLAHASNRPVKAVYIGRQNTGNTDPRRLRTSQNAAVKNKYQEQFAPACEGVRRDQIDGFDHCAHSNTNSSQSLFPGSVGIEVCQ